MWVVVVGIAGNLAGNSLFLMVEYAAIRVGLKCEELSRMYRL